MSLNLTPPSSPDPELSWVLDELLEIENQAEIAQNAEKASLAQDSRILEFTPPNTPIQGEDVDFQDISDINDIFDFQDQDNLFDFQHNMGALDRILNGEL